MRARWGTFIVLLILVLSGPIASSDATEVDGYVLLRLRPEAAEISLEVGLHDAMDGTLIAIIWEDGALLGHTGVGVVPSDAHAFLQLGQFGAGVNELASGELSPSSILVVEHDGGALHALIIAAGVVGGWSYALQHASADIIGLSNEAILLHPEDAPGAAHAEVRVYGAGAGVVRDGRASYHFEQTFLGFYGSPEPGPMTWTVETPSGPRECPCLFLDVLGPNAMSSGDHEFLRSGVHVGLPAAPILVGADVNVGPMFDDLSDA